MFHFIYKTVSSSGKYYIGRHSTNELDDGYMGSGRWVNSIEDKSTLTRHILQFCDSFEELKTLEELYLLDNVGRKNCMNFNMSSVGFSTGELNPAVSMESRERARKRLIENNPTKDKSVRDKISMALSGKPSPNKGNTMSMEGRQNISRSRQGKKLSESGRERLSDARKRQWKDKGTFYSWEGKTHSDETKQKQSVSAKNRQKKECPHCHGLFQPNIWARWHNDNCKDNIAKENMEN